MPCCCRCRCRCGGDLTTTNRALLPPLNSSRHDTRSLLQRPDQIKIKSKSNQITSNRANDQSIIIQPFLCAHAHRPEQSYRDQTSPRRDDRQGRLRKLYTPPRRPHFGTNQPITLARASRPRRRCRCRCRPPSPRRLRRLSTPPPQPPVPAASSP